MSDHQTQCQRILDLLICGGVKTLPYAGWWVPLPNILRLGIASHTRRIHELRKQGHVIEKREKYEGHQRHVFYRLVQP